jgi:hypothetical protein
MQLQQHQQQQGSQLQQVADLPSDDEEAAVSVSPVDSGVDGADAAATVDSAAGSSGVDGADAAATVDSAAGSSGVVPLTPGDLVQLVRGLTAVGGHPSKEWLSCWAGLLDAEAVRRLGGAAAASGVVPLMEVMSQHRMERMVLSVGWMCALLEGLPPVSELDARQARRLARLAARWAPRLSAAVQRLAED